MQAETIDVDSMAAGLELDALIAEKVMGWQSTSLSEQYGNVILYEWYDARGEHCSMRASHFCPSTNFSVASMVLDHVRRSTQFDWLIGTLNADRHWRALLIDTEGERHSASGDTILLAICRAALKAFI